MRSFIRLVGIMALCLTFSTIAGAVHADTAKISMTRSGTCGEAVSNPWKPTQPAYSLLSEKYTPNREITGDYDKSLAVNCENGTFVGRLADNVISFKGIPYATQPVGKLRWKPPRPVVASNKVYEAYHSGKISIQPGRKKEEMGENCLCLNIYLNKADKTKKKAVMVWIHGGAYQSGGNSSPNINGQNFVTNNPDVILVVINYRLGIMGFIDFSNIKGGEDYPHINLGIYDQIAALKWVKKNIEAFGGDTERITIFGESAGGGSVSALAVMKEAKGLFKRVIAQSGSVSFCAANKSSTVPADNLARTFGAKNMEQLLAIPEDKLIEYLRIHTKLDYNFMVMDGHIFEKDPFELWEEGATKDLDIMQGVMADEWRIFNFTFQPKELFDTVNKNVANRLYKSGNDEYRKLYAEYLNVSKTDDSAWQGCEFMRDFFFGYGMFRQAAAHAKNGGRGYVYIMDKQCDIPDFKAAHSSDVFYIFGNFVADIVKDTRENREFSRQIQKMWTNFAKTGDPSTENIQWRQYDNISYATMMLGSNIRCENDPVSKRRIVLEKMGKANPQFCHIKTLTDIERDTIEHYLQLKKREY